MIKIMKICSRTCSGSPSCYSSGCAIPQRRRYKTIENFLRRMAFNLGNTISQTDVKVLSCIPLDVTDLQKRISELEKELSEAKGENKNGTNKNGTDKGKRSSKDSGKKGKAKDTEEAKKKEETNTEGTKSEPGKEEEPKKEGDTEVMLVQTHRRRAEPTLRTNTMPGKNYLEDYHLSDSNSIEINSLHKVNDGKGRQAKEASRYNNADSSSDDNVENGNINAHRLAYRVKKQRHNPFTVIMGSVKRRKHIDTKKVEHIAQNTAYNQVCDSGSSYSVTVPLRKKENKNCPDCKVEGEVDHTIGRHKKKFNRVKEKMQTFIPRNQYVYYAQTNSQFNPDFKKEKSNCDLSYIANLIEKQYAPVGSLKEKDLLRQFSLPVCHDRDHHMDGLPNKYAINCLSPCSCCPGSNSRTNIRNNGVYDSEHIINVALPPSQHYYQTCSNNNGRFNDCTMYDMVPVKQVATKKHTELLTFEGIHQKPSKNKSPTRKPKTELDPPFNLLPSCSYDIVPNYKENLKHLQNHDRGLRRHHDKHNENKKKVQSSRHSRMKTTNKHKITVDPEDIYMTNILQSDSDVNCMAEPKETPNNENKTKSNEMTEIKAILQNFVKELKHDMPKLQGTINTPDSVNLKHDGINGMQQTVTPINNHLATQCAYMPSYPSVLPATQCCCPILCPVNFVPEAYKAHQPNLSSVLHQNRDECCINNHILKTDQNANSENLANLPETKKLIDAIYKSVSLQNENKRNHNTKTDSESEDKIKLNNNKPSIKARVTENPSYKCNTSCLKTTCPHCGGNRNLSGDTTETESKELNQNLTDRSASSVRAESCVMSAENSPGQLRKNVEGTKKSKFSNFLKVFAFKKSGQPVDTSEIEIKNFTYEEKPSFRQNVSQYSVICQRDRSRQNAQRKALANRNINSENQLDDVYNDCYFDNEQPSRDRNQHTDHTTPPRKCCSPRSVRRREEPRCYHDPRDISSNCFYTSESHNIPFCLKEIEVKNAGTQIEKRKRFFAIFKKLKSSSDSEYSNHHIQKYNPIESRAGVKREMSHTQTEVKKKKKTFLEILKGEPSFDYETINKYNFIDHGTGSVGMRRTRPSMLHPNGSSSILKKGGIWKKYMRSFERAKQREIAHRKLKWFNRNPFSFRNIVMKTLIGQKPVPNTKAAKAFY